MIAPNLPLSNAAESPQRNCKTHFQRWLVLRDFLFAIFQRQEDVYLLQVVVTTMLLRVAFIFTNLNQTMLHWTLRPKSGCFATLRSANTHCFCGATIRSSLLDEIRTSGRNVICQQSKSTWFSWFVEALVAVVYIRFFVWKVAKFRLQFKIDFDWLVALCLFMIFLYIF